MITSDIILSKFLFLANGLGAIMAPSCFSSSWVEGRKIKPVVCTPRGLGCVSHAHFLALYLMLL